MAEVTYGQSRLQSRSNGRALTAAQELISPNKCLKLAVFCQQLIHQSISYTKTCRVARYSHTHCTVRCIAKKYGVPSLAAPRLPLSLSVAHTHTHIQPLCVTSSTHSSTQVLQNIFRPDPQKNPNKKHPRCA